MVYMRKFAALTSSLIVSVALLAGCSSDSDSEASARTPSMTTEQLTATSTSGEDGAFKDVDPATFANRNSHVFSFNTTAGGEGMCMFTEEVATCTGEAANDVPDVEVPPFPASRPGAATVSAAGIRYTMVEGVPPAEAALGTQERVKFGEVTCEMSEKSDLTCSVGKNALHVSGANPDLTTSGTVIATEPTAAQSSSQSASATTSESPSSPATETNLDGDYSEDDEPVAPGTMCGAASGNTLVKVESGTVSCLDAQSIIDEYKATRQESGGGNTLAMMVQGWSCSTPTGGRAQETGASIICDGPDGEHITAP